MPGGFKLIKIQFGLIRCFRPLGRSRGQENQQHNDASILPLFPEVGILYNNGDGARESSVLRLAIQKSGERLVLDEPTPGDGNCCSRALVQQCQRPPVKLFLHSRGVTINDFMQLKRNVAQFIHDNRHTARVQHLEYNFHLSQNNIHHEGLRRRTWQQYWTDMQKDAGMERGIHWWECWADDTWLQAAAYFLNLRVHIIRASNDTQGGFVIDVDGNWATVAEEKPTLFLGYMVNSHYQSLLPLGEDHPPLIRGDQQLQVDLPPLFWELDSLQNNNEKQNDAAESSLQPILDELNKAMLLLNDTPTSIESISNRLC